MVPSEKCVKEQIDRDYSYFIALSCYNRDHYPRDSGFHNPSIAIS